MLTEKDYCDTNLIVALEKLGFPIRRIKIKGKEKTVPILLYEAQKFLREEKKIHIEVLYQPVTWTCKIYILKTYEYIKGYTFFNYYEEALLEGIKEAIKLLKEEINYGASTSKV